MSLISTGSMSLDSTFKQNFYSLDRKKVGGADRAVEYEKLLVQWIEEKFYQIQVIVSFFLQFLQVSYLFLEIQRPHSKIPPLQSLSILYVIEEQIWTNRKRVLSKEDMSVHT